jgi:hypothetical protein
MRAAESPIAVTLYVTSATGLPGLSNNSFFMDDAITASDYLAVHVLISNFD